MPNGQAHLDNHGGYLQSWIKVLTKHPMAIFAAAKAADKISEYMLGLERQMAATLKDHVGCVEALLPSGDARAVDEDGGSALIYACQHMRLDCAKALLPVSDVDRKAADGRGAIHHATGWGDAELVCLIKSYQLAQSEAGELSCLGASSVPGSASPRL